MGSPSRPVLFRYVELSQMYQECLRTFSSLSLLDETLEPHASATCEKSGHHLLDGTLHSQNLHFIGQDLELLLGNQRIREPSEQSLSLSCFTLAYFCSDDAACQPVPSLLSVRAPSLHFGELLIGLLNVGPRQCAVLPCVARRSSRTQTSQTSETTRLSRLKVRPHQRC